IDTIEVSPSSFDVNDIGENTVTFTVTDTSGLFSTCTAIVTVTENTLGNPDLDDQDVTIRPNPFNTSITIKLPLTYNNSTFTIEVFDLNGRLVYDRLYQSMNGTINVTGLERLDEAPYFLKVTDRNTNFSVMKKLIKHEN